MNSTNRELLDLRETNKQLRKQLEEFNLQTAILKDEIMIQMALQLNHENKGQHSMRLS